jgi:putative tryptophan/tyrosine transport system substrate-binding protein
LRAYLQIGAYARKALKGANAADLTVQQSTKVELVINLKTAKALDLPVPSECSPCADLLRTPAGQMVSK